jgi:hypothetical protein
MNRIKERMERKYKKTYQMYTLFKGEGNEDVKKALNVED